MKRRRHCTFILVVLCLIVCNTLPARADSVTGTAHVGWPYGIIYLSSDHFGVASIWPGESPSDTLAWGSIGTLATMWGAAWSYGGNGNTDGGIFNSSTHQIIGGLEIKSAPVLITDAIIFAGTFTAPITVEGVFTAYQDVWENDFSSPGNLLGSFHFTGTGVGTFPVKRSGDNYFWVMGGDVTFTGTGTAIAATPEPASLFLLSTGFAGMAMMVRRSRNLFRMSGKS